RRRVSRACCSGTRRSWHVPNPTTLTWRLLRPSRRYCMIPRSASSFPVSRAPGTVRGIDANPRRRVWSKSRRAPTAPPIWLPLGEWAILDPPMIVNLWRYRGFIVRNALSDVRHRYAGSAAGVAWNVINPLAQILIYSLVFSQIMAVRMPGGGTGTAFALYLCAGLLAWAAFSEVLLRGSNAFIQNPPYVNKL